MAKRVYKGDIPVNIKKAFAERLRYQRVKGRTNTDEYKRIMELRSRGEITRDIAESAFRVKKVSREISERDKLAKNIEYWKSKGLEYTSKFQRVLKKINRGEKVNAGELPRVRGYNLKKLKLESLLEQNKEYIYGEAKYSESDGVEMQVLSDLINKNQDMFARENIDMYIDLIETYAKSKSETVKKYDKYMGIKL